jgi:hypothetical protein
VSKALIPFNAQSGNEVYLVEYIGHGHNDTCPTSMVVLLVLDLGPRTFLPPSTNSNQYVVASCTGIGQGSAWTLMYVDQLFCLIGLKFYVSKYKQPIVSADKASHWQMLYLVISTMQVSLPTLVTRTQIPTR